MVGPITVTISFRARRGICNFDYKALDVLADNSSLFELSWQYLVGANFVRTRKVMLSFRTPKAEESASE